MAVSYPDIQEKNVGAGYVLSELKEHTHPLPQDSNLLVMRF